MIRRSDRIKVLLTLPGQQETFETSSPTVRWVRSTSFSRDIDDPVWVWRF